MNNGKYFSSWRKIYNFKNGVSTWDLIHFMVEDSNENIEKLQILMRFIATSNGETLKNKR